MRREGQTLREVRNVGFEFGDQAPLELALVAVAERIEPSPPRRNLSRAMTRKAFIAQGPASPFFILPLDGSRRANGQAPI